jgi:hypothetical protein
MMRCVHCDTELVAPVRSEYWSDKRACYIWHCQKSCACFSSVVSFPADTTTVSVSLCWSLKPAGLFHALPIDYQKKRGRPAERPPGTPNPPFP